MTVPLIGRFSLSQWPVVLFSFIAIYLEFLISVITKLLPNWLIDICTLISKSIHSKISSQRSIKPLSLEEIRLLKLRNLIRSCENIQDMGHIWGIEIDEHIVKTQDDYLLTLHRIRPKTSRGAPVCYLHHGLLMSSEIWCTCIKKDKNLPFLLHDLGYDVWMGNNRGNKYSSKHINLKPNDSKFWDFSIDQFALYDIPDSINYILNYTQLNKLTYIGFSQGSAQAFASLSINPILNDQINLFIAISPAMTPQGLHHKLVDALMKASPNIMYLIFGKRTLLPTASFWQQITYPPLFSTIIDLSNEILFDWKSQNINFNQKIASFAHLYSPTSVKSVVHWFQIIRNSSFQMFDEDLSITNKVSKPFKIPCFPTKTNIKTPIRLLYGSVDSLVDINKMLDLLPKEDIKAIPVENHEHLDLIWGDEIEKLVFPFVMKFLEEQSEQSERSERSERSEALSFEMEQSERKVSEQRVKSER